MSWECWCASNVFSGATSHPGSRSFCPGCNRKRADAIDRDTAFRALEETLSNTGIPHEAAATIPCESCGMRWGQHVSGCSKDPTRQADEPFDPMQSPALARQVGGRHYKGLAIQPVEYCMANGLGGMEFSVVKYVSRWREKGGIQDLEKAKHYIEMLIEWEQAQQAKAGQTESPEG